MQKLLSPEVEIEHILPFQTLDDSLNNKTVFFKKANRVKEIVFRGMQRRFLSMRAGAMMIF